MLSGEISKAVNLKGIRVTKGARAAVKLLAARLKSKKSN